MLGLIFFYWCIACPFKQAGKKAGDAGVGRTLSDVAAAVPHFNVAGMGQLVQDDPRCSVHCRAPFFVFVGSHCFKLPPVLLVSV